MSKDIRSFFKPKPSTKVKSGVNVSDDDVIPDSPNVQIKSKKKESRKRRVLNDSSDEDSVNKDLKISKSKDKGLSKDKSKKPKSSNLKEVKASDLFRGPIKRTEPIVKTDKKSSKTETGIHSDDEFEKSLLELDEIDTGNDKDKRCDAKDSNVTHKENHNEEHSKYFNKNISKKSLTTKKQLVNGTTSSEHKFKETSNINNKNDNKTEIIEKQKSVKDIKDKIKNENKRGFSEFINDNESQLTNDEKHESKRKKRKTDNESQLTNDDNQESKSKQRKPDKTLNESVVSDEERYEKKRHSAILYQNYLNRSGPKHLGAKQIPEGIPGCLKDCSFLLTGVLDSFEREEIAETITKYGGTIKNGISKKVTHILAGEDGGPAKLAKAQELNIKIINEDEFLLMIKDSKSSKTPFDSVKSKHSKIGEKNKEKVKLEIKSEESVSTKKGKDDKIKKETSPSKITEIEAKIKKNFYPKDKSETNGTSEKISLKIESNKLEESNSQITKTESNEQSQVDDNILMWVDKYKPQTLKNIIGQHGDSSNAKKLMNWLTKWYVSRKEKLTKPSPWAKNDNGAYFKAALLSGPPGVGKTTTVAIVCKELGFDMVEFNASDTRSKNLIKEQISELLTTSSLSGFAKGVTGKRAVTKKHVLVMDEVDGMAGNEDRGGLQELINLIKISAVPIICMCNDRNSQKMRTLVNYCYDLKFSRPRVDQIKSAMLSVCHKEGVKIHPEALTQIIVAANQDVRQTLNLLSMWSINNKQMSTEQVKDDAKNAKKDMKLGPWEAVRKVFSAEEHKTMSINDKSDLFFYDYSIAPLFVQENYLQVAPHCPQNEILSRVSMAADSISLGDLVEAKVRGQGAWNLLPLQAMYSSVIPGHAMSGHVAGQIQFPSWLGKNSRRNKMHRLCQEIHAHTRLSTTGSKSSIYLDYCTPLRDAIVMPLVKDKTDGIPKTLEVMQAYNLLREDLDSLTELSLWPGQRDPMVLVDSKVKAAMTRTYNKEASALPYAPGVIKKTNSRVDVDDNVEDGDDVTEGADSDSDPENDALIKKKSKSSVKIASTEKPSTSKGSKGKKSKSQK